MTACAMTVGMVPMALALERGSQMQAPLGLAVIGGLVMSTFATLLVLPSIFAIVIGRGTARSSSLYPDDPQSAYYDPSGSDRPVQPDEAAPRREGLALAGSAGNLTGTGGGEPDGGPAPPVTENSLPGGP